MTRLLALLVAEGSKVRRTPVPWLVVAAPWVVVAFFALFAFHDGERFLSDERAWTWLFESSLTFWTLVVLPLWAAILTAQVAAVEHAARGLDHLFALPVRRMTVYWAKQILCWLLTAVGFVLLGVAVVVFGLLLRWWRPGMGFEEPLPVDRVPLLATAFLASLFLVALHTWLAHLRTDLATPIAVGFLATISVLALAGFDADLVPYLPWAYPSELVRAATTGAWEPSWAVAGTVGGVLFALVAGLSFVRRDVL